MLRRGQEGHVRAEKDLLAAAASASSASSSWIVKLHYSFQDIDHLYLVGSRFETADFSRELICLSYQVLNYEGGGDLLNLLVERDTFPEDFTRFYIAEVRARHFPVDCRPWFDDFNKLIVAILVRCR